MWWMIPSAIFEFVLAIFVVVCCIKSYRYKKEKFNKLSIEGTQSTLRHFNGVEENEDEEKNDL